MPTTSDTLSNALILAPAERLAAVTSRPCAPVRQLMSDKIKVAITGSGNICTDLMIKVLRNSDILEMARWSASTPAPTVLLARPY